MPDRGPRQLIVVVAACLSLLAVGCGGQSDEELIVESIEELSGPAVSVDHCDEIGESDSREVLDCFGESYAKGSQLGCYSVGNFDNVIEEDCRDFRPSRAAPK